VSGGVPAAPRPFATTGSGWEDPWDVRRAIEADGRLRDFNDALVLHAGDVHIARRLGIMAGEADDTVLLAAALAARGPRLGHICVDLATAATTTTSDRERPGDGEGLDVTTLPWPPLGGWLAALTASPLVATGSSPTAMRPLHLDGTLLYLDRYWRQEREVAADLTERSTTPADVDAELLAAGLERLFGGDAPDLQRLAAAVAVLRRFAVIAGGPGTGKTTTVARVLALLDEQATATGAAAPKVALAAPTGKAAARLQESVHTEAASLPVAPAVRARLLGLRASTIHRLLGWRADSSSRFRHDRTNRLPFDAVVIDETSMVSLSLMAKLVEAVRLDARLVLVGDPNQLSSVEAGAVLGDLVGPSSGSLRMTATARAVAATTTAQVVPATDPPPRCRIGDGIVVLRRVHRFGGGIAEVADAIQRGDAAGTLRAIARHPDAVTWLTGTELGPVRAAVVAAGRDVVAAARAGNGRGALDALGAVRVLCAHRVGPAGVSTWIARAERWLSDSIADYGRGGHWYPGRPLLVTQNDYSLGVYNGDVGVIVDTGNGHHAAAFERQGEVVLLSPTRLEAVETVHAMTIHKSQGSQFDTVAVVLPDPESRLLTRELLYTAVTRARTQVLLVGGEDSIRAAVGRPVARASGLRTRLWGPDA
jgi:exodeoxyribonuclease V alpha subunit